MWAAIREPLRGFVTLYGTRQGPVGAPDKGLRDKGLLTSDTDPQDRRSMRLTLTDAGLQVRNVMHQQGQNLNQLGISGLSEDEHQQLLSLVHRVYENFKQI